PLYQAEAGIEEIADQADHRHTQECQVHVHHLPSDHHDSPQTRSHPDHFGCQYTHPGTEEIDPHDDEELGEDSGKDDMLNYLAPTRAQDTSGVDIDLIHVMHIVDRPQRQREHHTDEHHEDGGPITDAKGKNSQGDPGD